MTRRERTRTARETSRRDFSRRFGQTGPHLAEQPSQTVGLGCSPDLDDRAGSKISAVLGGTPNTEGVRVW